MTEQFTERITEYLDIDLEKEVWCCNRCGHVLAPARQNYKTGLLVYERDPREIHRPMLNEKEYHYTYAPDPNWCRLLEYYCPGCGTLVETEYLVPGHPITHDIELDIEWFKRRAKENRAREETEG
ncbi:MAG: acetophenone carboxylase [Bacillus thermozeamaize]|uniref:Acetophenone carboxylase n=1 Tax=Bacillus thermozeamaize TaxID=230954 RepID=A0A1Y3PFF6_9BACI|nr:MAG: acetophenone carboxylase [Bacillus thermozeamaize]